MLNVSQTIRIIIIVHTAMVMKEMELDVMILMNAAIAANIAILMLIA